MSFMYGDMYTGVVQNGYQNKPVTKRYLIDYISNYYQTGDVNLVDGFETNYTRHICNGGNKIQILNSFVFNVPTPNGIVSVNVIYCPNCRKLIIDRNSLEVI